MILACCCGCANEITWTVLGCNDNPVVGATVKVIFSGSTIATATTNASGVATLTATVPGPGAGVTVRVESIDNYAQLDTSVVLFCEAVAQTVSLSPVSTNVCSCCNKPIPKTFYATTVAGPVTLTHSGGVWASGPFAVATTRAAGCTLLDCCDPLVDPKPQALALAGGTTQMTIQVYCDNGTWKARTGARILYGRTGCGEDTADWGHDAGSCTPGNTLATVAYEDVEVIATLSGTCADGVVALSGSFGDFDDLAYDPWYDRPLCVTPGPDEFRSFDLTNPLEGGISVSS